MVRRGLFQELRRRGAVLGAVLVYALLVNALTAVVFDVRAIAASLDPLAAAATCDTSAPDNNRDPVRHEKQHQPDCTLACSMAGSVQSLGGAVAEPVTPPASSFALHAVAPRVSSVNPPSVYLSDTAAQAPPAIG